MKWQPTLNSYLGKSHGQRSLRGGAGRGGEGRGYSPWGPKESNKTERLSLHTSVRISRRLLVLMDQDVLPNVMQQPEQSRGVRLPGRRKRESIPPSTHPSLPPAVAHTSLLRLLRPGSLHSGSAVVLLTRHVNELPGPLSQQDPVHPDTPLVAVGPDYVHPQNLEAGGMSIYSVCVCFLYRVYFLPHPHSPQPQYLRSYSQPSISARSASMDSANHALIEKKKNVFNSGNFQKGSLEFAEHQ